MVSRACGKWGLKARPHIPHTLTRGKGPRKVRSKRKKKGAENMKAIDLIRLLEQKPFAEVLVMMNEDYDEKYDHLTPYVDSDGKIIIQFWSNGKQVRARGDSTGRWMHTVGQRASYRYCCSVCGKIAYFVHGNNSKNGYEKKCTYQYCPNCGAKMDGEGS